ncbi:hypothetical protein ES705_37499 [subsurface metagenome]
MERRAEMSKIESIAIIILIIAVICLIVIPRLYYQTNNPGDTTDIITAIYNASVIQINAIYTASAVQIGLLGGLIVLLMGLIISLRK